VSRGAVVVSAAGVVSPPGAVARPAAGITSLVWRPAGPMRWPVS